MRMLDASILYFLSTFNVSRFVPLQLKVLEEGLVNHPVVGFGESGRKTNELRILLAKIEESEVCDSPFGCLIYIIYLSQLIFCRYTHFSVPTNYKIACFSSLFRGLKTCGFAICRD
jgi:hypothetical protein